MSRAPTPETARRTAQRYESSRWIPVAAAALFAGVCENTMRAWADAGHVVSQRTPGGHRRIDRESLLSMTDADQQVALEIARGLGN